MDGRTSLPPPAHHPSSCHHPPQVYLQAPSTLQPSFLQTVGLSSFVFGSASRSDIHPILPSSLCLKIQPDLCGSAHIPRAGATGAQQAARPWAWSPEPEARSPVTLLVQPPQSHSVPSPHQAPRQDAILPFLPPTCLLAGEGPVKGSWCGGGTG